MIYPEKKIQDRRTQIHLKSARWCRRAHIFLNACGIFLFLFAAGCSGKAKEATSAKEPIVPSLAIETFPLEDLPFASMEGSDDQILEFRDVSTFTWPDPLTADVGAKVLSLSRVRDENFEEKYANEVKISELEANVKNGPAELQELRRFFDQNILAQETKVTGQRSGALPTVVKNHTRQLAEKGELPRTLETIGELVDFFNSDSDVISPRTQEILAVVTNPGMKRNLENKINGILRSRSELKTASQQLRQNAQAAGYSAEIETEFRNTDTEILRLKSRNDSNREGKIWTQWPLAQQNQRITEIIPHLVGLQAELMSYPEVTLTRSKSTGSLSLKVARFNPCFTGAEFANELEFSTQKNTLYDVHYEARGGVLSFNFIYEGPGTLQKEIPAYEIRTVTTSAGAPYLDRRGYPVIDFFPILKPIISSDENTPGFEQIKKSVTLQCNGGAGDIKIKRVRYAVKNQIVFQGDLTLTDRVTGITRRGIFRMARDRK